MTDPFSISKLFGALKAAFGFASKVKKKNEDALVRDLDGIIDLLAEIKKSFEAGRIPRQQSYELAKLINFADDRLKVFFPIVHVEDVFSKRLPRIGYLMREADFFIDGERREHKHEYMRVAREEDLHIDFDWDISQELYKEIDRALGELRGARRGLAGRAARTVKNSS